MFEQLNNKIQSFDMQILLKYLWENITFETFLKFLVIYFIIVWIAILVWVIKDISNRTENVYIQLLAILIILFLTPFWVFIYLIIRPAKTLFERYYEEVEANLDCLSEEVKLKVWKTNLEKTKCMNCDSDVEKDFKYCPKCKLKLSKKCKDCGKKMDLERKNCPYCGWKKKKTKKTDD